MVHDTSKSYISSVRLYNLFVSVLGEHNALLKTFVTCFFSTACRVRRIPASFSTFTCARERAGVDSRGLRRGPRKGAEPLNLPVVLLLYR